MDYIRLLNPKKFDRKSNKWFDVAFRNSPSDGSLSVIDEQCVQSTGNTICDHIRKYWTQVRGVVGDPIIFWKFDSGIFPPGHTIVQQTAKNGDVCHNNVWGIADPLLYPLIENRPLSEFSVCDNGNDRPLTRADLG